MTKNQEGVVVSIKEAWPDSVLGHNLVLCLEPQGSVNSHHSTNISKSGAFPGASCVSGVQKDIEVKLPFSPG